MTAKGIGLDIGSTALRAAEVRFNRGGASLRRIGQVDLPEGAVVDGVVEDGPAVTSALKRLWRETRLTGRTVQLGTSSRRVVVRQVDLPDMPREDLAQALPFQVADLLSMPVQDAVLDFHLLERLTTPSGALVQRGMLVAAPRDEVLGTVKAVEAAGLRVGSVDLAPFALIRSLGGRWHEQPGTEMLVDVGARTTNLTIHTGGTPHLVRILQAGGQDLTDALSRMHGTSAGEAEALKTGSDGSDADEQDVDRLIAVGLGHLMDEVRSSLDYFASSSPQHHVTSVVLTGGGAQVPRFAENLSAVAELPVRVGDALARIGGPGAAHAAPGAAATSSVAVGLALGLAA